jgi:hypothetical protein
VHRRITKLLSAFALAALAGAAPICVAACYIDSTAKCCAHAVNGPESNPACSDGPCDDRIGTDPDIKWAQQVTSGGWKQTNTLPTQTCIFYNRFCNASDKCTENPNPAEATCSPSEVNANGPQCP